MDLADVETAASKLALAACQADRTSGFGGVVETLRPHVEREAALAREVERMRAERDGYKANCVHLARQYDDQRANLKALREKAGAFCEKWYADVPEDEMDDDVIALRAELDKPTGAGLVAERDAWRALAIARANGPQYNGPDPAHEYWKSSVAEHEAIEKLRALGIDPEPPPRLALLEVM